MGVAYELRPVRGGLIRPDFVLDDGVVVEVDGPYHYSSEPSASVLAGLEDADAGLDDWFAGVDGDGSGQMRTDAETETGTDAETETMEGAAGGGSGRGRGARGGRTVAAGEYGAPEPAFARVGMDGGHRDVSRVGTRGDGGGETRVRGKVTRRRRAEAAIERRRREVAGEKPSLK